MTNIDYSGLYAFSRPGDDFPIKGIYYRGSCLIVPDWSVNHDPGDEDDGEHKAINARLNREQSARTGSCTCGRVFIND